MLCRHPSAAAVSLWEGGLRMVTGSRDGTELLLPFRNWKFNKKLIRGCYASHFPSAAAFLSPRCVVYHNYKTQ